MNKDVDSLLEVAGNKGRYQYWILGLAFGFWVTLDLLSISLPYLEKTSTLKMWDKSDKTYKNVSLNYDTCKNKNLYENRTIVEQSGHSWVIEFGIECDKVRTGMIGSLSFLGVLVGSMLIQFLPDSIGRRNSIIIGATGFSLILLCFNFAPSYNYILVYSFLLQAFGYLALLTVFMMSTEITAIELRSLFGAIINSAFSISGVFYILLYKYLNDWRVCFTLASFINLTVVFLFCKVGLESPRYYNAKGEMKNLLKSVASIAIFNGRGEEFKNEIKEVSISSSHNQNSYVIPEPVESSNISGNGSPPQAEKSPEEEDVLDLDTKKKVTTPPNSNLMLKSSFFSLFKYASVRRPFLILCYLWFSISGIYYGLSIYIKNLPGDIYMNGIFIYVSEIFSYVISGWIINIPSIGRRGSMMIFASVSLIGYMTLLMFNFNNYYKTLFSFLARFAISGVYNVLYTYSTEVYPTVVRAKGFGFNSITARLGGIIFPLLIELLEGRVIFIFTMLNFLALMLCFLLPETYGKPLEDKIREQEQEMKIYN